MTQQQKIDRTQLRRTPQNQEAKIETPPVANSLKATLPDFMFNSTPDKLREMTVIDRVQARMFPLLDMMNSGVLYLLEIAEYRQNKKAYVERYAPEGKTKPLPPNMMQEWLHRTAQWQKSVGGKNLEKAGDIVLADIESNSSEGDTFGSKDPFKDG